MDRHARRSPVVVWGTRAGLVGYGVVHLLVAWVAIRVVLGRQQSRTTGAGALATLTHDTLGRVTLGVLAGAFAMLVIWQLGTAAVGFRRMSGWERGINRLGALTRVGVYGYFLFASVKLLTEAPSGGARSPRATAATVLAQPLGAVLLFGAAVVIAAVGVALAWFGVATKFVDQLDDESLQGAPRRVVLLVGRVGYALKGASFVLIGVMFAWAALTRDARRTGGLDAVFEQLLGHTLGPLAVVAAGCGIGCFGLYLWARAAYLDRESLTS